jgi:hypothetical protein
MNLIGHRQGAVWRFRHKSDSEAGCCELDQLFENPRSNRVLLLCVFLAYEKVILV